MTEDEWLKATDVGAMLDHLGTRAPVSKLNRFAATCCQSIEYLLQSDDAKRCRYALLMLQRYVDGIANESELEQTLSDSLGEMMDAGHAVAHPGQADLYAISAAAYTVSHLIRKEWAGISSRVCEAIAYTALAVSGNKALAELTARWLLARSGGDSDWQRDQKLVQEIPEYVRAYQTVKSAHATLLRDIFGNPFRPVAFNPAWRTDTAVAVARQMYDSRDFGAMPILADALQDAGCEDEQVLSHCREPGPHVRGCWVCDFVVGYQ